MIRTGLYIFLFFVVAIHSHAQYSDLKFYGLKGKVKTITSRGYRSAELSINGWKANEDSLLIIRQYYFDPQGMLDSLTTTTLFPNKTYRYVTEYIKTNGKLSGLKQYSSDDDVVFTSEIVWEDSLKSKTIYTSNGGYRSETVEFFAPNYRSIGNVFKSYEGDSLISHVETLNFYNDDNMYVMALEKDILKKETIISNYDHLELDKWKNNLVTVMTNEKGVFDMLYIRTYEYYP